MDIYDVVTHLTSKLRIKLSLKINNLRDMAQNWISIIKSNWIFSKLCLLIYMSSYNRSTKLFMVISNGSLDLRG